ncbi:hypothetical protein ALC60_09576 [Trachymyrmex zeteki]|uniref:Uncharacterized protein n=1 Tax=Mycetomoellerius zeteki TaxID=64791 RepID=A0A151WUH0_9HYME|nr:hypothetical protein ALC60_09576 [Trachymyrmex zeteki]
MPTFREAYTLLYQGEEQPDTELRAVPFMLRCLLEYLEEQLSIRLLLALIKWTVRFTKRWHSKNESGHGENP